MAIISGGWLIFTKAFMIGSWSISLSRFSKALALEAAGRQAEARNTYAVFLRLAPPEAREQVEQAGRCLQK
jgi:hypothetical protein